MKNTKNLITALLIVIVIIFVVGAYMAGKGQSGNSTAPTYYVDNTRQQPTQDVTTPPTPTELKDTLSVSSILKAVGTKLVGKGSSSVTFKINADGKYSAVLFDGKDVPRNDSSYTVDNIFRGNLNGDNYEDAVVVATACGASCGTDISFVINNPNNAVAVPVINNNLQLSGAAQVTIKNIVITNGKVAITVNDPLTNSLKTYNYAFVNNQTNIELIPQ